MFELGTLALIVLFAAIVLLVVVLFSTQFRSRIATASKDHSVALSNEK